MDLPVLRALLADQGGVVAAWQLRDLGAADHDVAWLIRRRELTRIYPGVFVNHTGEATQAQLDGGAVLRYWPAALASFSVLDLGRWQRGIHLMVDTRRTVNARAGIRVVRNGRFREQLRERPFPPRQRLEDAALDAAVVLPTADRRFALLADLLQTRRTTPERLGEALAARARIPNRTELSQVLADLAAGDASVLEREWHRLERSHGLPRGDRQVRVATTVGGVVRDVLYREWRVVVELDGRAFHDTAEARDRDAVRDLLAASESALLTIRLTYGQVFGEPCATVARVVQVLRGRGWRGDLLPCEKCLDRRSRSPGARDLRS